MEAEAEEAKAELEVKVVLEALEDLEDLEAKVVVVLIGNVFGSAAFGVPLVTPLQVELVVAEVLEALVDLEVLEVLEDQVV